MKGRAALGSSANPRVVLVLLGLVTLLGYFTFFHRYWQPPYLFWDENYHVAAAQKYLHGTFFMEPHPPLGKLLIALGERIVSPAENGQSDQFLDTDHAEETPAGFSFVGYRLVPSLLAWLAAPLFYLVLVQLIRRPVLAALLSSLYLFDNALVVHSRSAMLEPALIFFTLAMILCFLLVSRWPGDRSRRRLYSALLGCCLGALVTTKVTGLVMVLLFVPLIWRLYRQDDRWRAIGDCAGFAALGFIVVFVGVWQTHFSLASTPRPSLPEGGNYQASAEYKEILRNGTSGSLSSFGTMLRDSLAFVGHYQEGVPKLDLCKENENGSPWFFWPFGARAINYRWETDGDEPAERYRYLYLQANPVTWLLGLVGVVVAAALLIAELLLPMKAPLENRIPLVVFLGLWLAYMAAISRLDRVMYLYHYFLPLIFSYLLFGLVVMEVRQLGGLTLDGRRRLILVCVAVFFVIVGFWFYQPLTYYQPIGDADFMKRSLVRLWNLHCVRCDSTDPVFLTSCS